MQQNIKTFQIKQNATFPSLEIKVNTVTCLGSVVPFDLSAVTACTFSMKDDCGNLKIASSSASITSYSGGTIQYSWNDGDTDTSGVYKAEFELYLSGGTGSKMIIPIIGALGVNILKSVND